MCTTLLKRKEHLKARTHACACAHTRKYMHASARCKQIASAQCKHPPSSTPATAHTTQLSLCKSLFSPGTCCKSLSSNTHCCWPWVCRPAVLPLLNSPPLSTLLPLDYEGTSCRRCHSADGS